MVQLKGIDVSDARGDIDWNQVKPHIDFAMLRCGYGSDMTVQDDKQFLRNASECERLGIPYGVYLYSYALNISDAMSEAQHILRLIQGRKISFPICLDMEDADGYKERKGMPTNQMLVDICDTVLSTVERQGHYVSLYASLSWLNNQLNEPKLDRYDKWVAQWNSTCTYGKTYSLWQYSDQGNIPGIGLVDLDYSFKDFAGTVSQPSPAAPKENTYTIQPGDTLSGIAAKYGTSYQNLADINGIGDPNKIYVGQVIHINGIAAPAPGPIVYTVQRGDTLSVIAAKFGTSYQHLAAKNGISDPNRIYVGQKITI